MRHQIIHPEGWAPAKGYANGVLTDKGTLYVGGQIGWTAQQTWDATDFVSQMRQTLMNVRAVVEAAGGGPEHITRLTWFVTDKATYAAHQSDVGKAYRDVLGRNFPAMTLVVVKDLLEDNALIEIEATAELA